MTVLLDSDRERMENIMETVTKIRAQRLIPPVRNEEKIAAILRDAQRRADAEHQLLVESQSLFCGVGIKPQTPVTRSQNLRVFAEMVNWKRRFSENTV